MGVKMRQKKFILGGNPEETFRVPNDPDFEVSGEFVEAAGCQKIGEALIASYPSLRHLAGARIIYLWKRKGADKPRRKLGMCQRPGGLLGYFSQSEFIVTFFANNCRGFTNWQMEALVFHELKHADFDEGAPVVAPHDFEGFGEEIERYGFWKSDIKFIADAVQKSLQFPFDQPTQQDGNQKSITVQ